MQSNGYVRANRTDGSWRSLLLLLDSTVRCLQDQPSPDMPHVVQLRDCVVLPGQQPVWAPGFRPGPRTANQPNPLFTFAPGPPGRVVLARHAHVVLGAIEALVRLLPQCGNAPAEMWVAGEQPWAALGCPSPWARPAWLCMLACT